MSTEADRSKERREAEGEKYRERFYRGLGKNPNFAYLPRFAPYHPWRATRWDMAMTGLGAAVVVAIVVINLF